MTAPAEDAHPTPPPRRLGRLAQWAARAAQAGITTAEPMVRRRQMFTNILAGVAALNALFHLVANALYDLDGLAVVHAYNFGMVAFCLVNHRLHARGDLVAAVVLLIGFIAGHSFVIAAFGTASDLHVYFTLAGFTLFLIGIENFRLFLALAGLAFAALVGVMVLVPEYGFVLTADHALRRNLQFEALISAFVMNGLLITLALTALHRAEERAESLIAAMLPRRVAERLKLAENRRIADRVEGCSVLFLDMVGFTEAANQRAPEEVVAWLDRLFSQFDRACRRLGADKIKTIGDGYMAAAGLDGDADEGARAIGQLALDLGRIIETAPALGSAPLAMRAGIHTGPVTAGVIGDIAISYDIWGDTVNTASRLEAYGVPGAIHVSDAFRTLARPWFTFTARGPIEIRGLGRRETWFLTGPRDGPDG